MKVGASCIAVLLALLVVSGPAVAAPKRITGKLSKSGYTVIALASNGKAKSAVAKQGRTFRLRPPAKRVSLHLRAPDGRYAGPVVISGRGRRAILGVKAGARLGKIDISPGYARLGRRLPRRWIDAALEARARKGVPIGARLFGRVRSKPPRRSVPGDRDRDGIPNPLDIDDDGDRILDNLERSNRVRAAQAARQEFAFEFNLPADISETANANATGLPVAQTEALLSNRGSLSFEVVRGDSTELDCGSPQSRTDPLLGGLSYCSKGGTGRLVKPGSNADAGPFPDCCDADGDGFGTLTGAGMLLMPRATTAQIGTGDVMIQRVTTGGAETHFAATLQYVFATVPALVSYSDQQGNSATVQYPVPTANCGSPPCPAPGPGTWENPFAAKAGPGGDIIGRLTFWRPQRRPIPPETGEWTDIGGLVYEVEGGNSGRDCPQRAYSTTDPNLTPAPLPAPEGEDETGGLRDLAPDRPANPSNTVTITVNLSACLRARRVEFPGPESWKQGETKVFSVRGTDRTAYAAQTIAFRRQ